MKKLLFYIISNNNPNQIYLEHKNKLISYDDVENKHFFHSKYNVGKEEINITYRELKFNENLFKDLSDIYKKSVIEASKISEEPIGIRGISNPYNISEDDALSPIFSIICKYQYLETQEIKTVFDFASDIFITMLMDHKLKNGNKRVSFVFLINLLRYLGFHFYWSKGMELNYEVHKSQIEIFVEDLQSLNQKEKNEQEELKINILKWIKNNCIIALEWR